MQKVSLIQVVNLLTGLKDKLIFNYLIIYMCQHSVLTGILIPKIEMLNSYN